MKSWGGKKVARTRRNIVSYLHCLPFSLYERCLLYVIIQEAFKILSSKTKFKEDSGFCFMFSPLWSRGYINVVIFEVIAVVAESYNVYWDVTQCKLLEIYQHSEKHVSSIFWVLLCPQDRLATSLQTFVSSYKNLSCHIPEDIILEMSHCLWMKFLSFDWGKQRSVARVILSSTNYLVFGASDVEMRNVYPNCNHKSCSWDTHDGQMP